MGILQSIRAKFIGTLSDDYKLLCDAIMHEVAVEASWANVKGCPIIHAAELAHTNNQGPKPWANKHAYLISCNGLPLTRVQWIELLDCTEDDITENNVVLLTTTMVGELVSAVYEGDDADIIIEIQEEIPEFLNNSAIAQADLSDSPIAILDYAFKAQQDKALAAQNADKNTLLCIGHFLGNTGLHIANYSILYGVFKVYKDGASTYYQTIDDSVVESPVEKAFYRGRAITPSPFVTLYLHENDKKLPVIDKLSGTSTGGIPAHVIFAALANSLIPTSSVTFNLPGISIDCSILIVDRAIPVSQVYSSPNDLVQALVAAAQEYIYAPIGSDSIYYISTTGFTYTNTKQAIVFNFGVAVLNLQYFTDAYLTALKADGTYETISINGALPSPATAGMFNIAVQSSGNKYLYLTSNQDIDLSLASKTYWARLVVSEYSIWSGISLATINADGIYIVKNSQNLWELLRIKSDYIGSSVSVSTYQSTMVKLMKSLPAPETYAGDFYVSVHDYSSEDYKYYICTKSDIGETSAQFDPLWFWDYSGGGSATRKNLMLVDLESSDGGHGVTYLDRTEHFQDTSFNHVVLSKTVQELRACFAPVASFKDGGTTYYIYNKQFIALRNLLELTNETDSFSNDVPTGSRTCINMRFKVNSERNDACSDSTLDNRSAMYGGVVFTLRVAGYNNPDAEPLKISQHGDVTCQTSWQVYVKDLGGVNFWCLIKNGKLYYIPVPGAANYGVLVDSAWDYSVPYSSTGTWSYTGTTSKPFSLNSLNNELCLVVLGPMQGQDGWYWQRGSAVNTVYLTTEVALTPASNYDGPMIGNKPIFTQGTNGSYSIAYGPIKVSMQDIVASTVYRQDAADVTINSANSSKITTQGKYKVPLDYTEEEGVPSAPTGFVQSHNKNVVALSQNAWLSKWGYNPKWIQDYGTQNKTQLPVIVGLSDEVNKQIRDKIRPAIWLKRVVTSITHSYLGQYPILNYTGEQSGYNHPYAWSDGTVTRYTAVRNPKVGDVCYTYRNSNINSYTIGKVWETYV